MKYHFVCDNCKTEKTVDIPMGSLKEIYCDKCNSLMHQDYNGGTVIIPDYMKAGTEESDSTEWIFDRLQNNRFSGKDQIYF